MGLLLTLTFGLILWIVLWSLGAKGFDAFMLTMLLVIVAATARLILPNLPGNRADD